MFVLLFIALSALFLGGVGNPIDPTITPPPILPRQLMAGPLDPLAWVLVTSGSNTEVEAWNLCDGTDGLVVSSSYARCCDPTDVQRCLNGYVATACNKDTLILMSSMTATCTTGELCMTDTLYWDSTSNADSLLKFIGCTTGTPSQVFYLELPTSVRTSSTSFSATSSRSTSQSPSATSPSGAPSETAVESPTSVTSMSTPVFKKESSKAWIAGVVVGTVALLAIAGMAFWLLRRRKRDQRQSYSKAPQTTQVYPEGNIPGDYNTPELNRSSLSPHQDAGRMSQSTSDQRTSQVWSEDSRGKSTYQHNLSPGPQTAAPPVASTALSELPELVNSPSRR